MSERDNYMQKVFDTLRASHPDLLSLSEIAQRAGLNRATVRNTMKRLSQLHVLRSVVEERRYGVKPNAQRPHDSRGQRVNGGAT